MPAHRHTHHRIPPISADQLAADRWTDDGGPAFAPGPTAEQLEAEWLRISAALTKRFPALSGRDDVIVSADPVTVSGAKAAFFPTLGRVEVDQHVFAPHDPHRLDPAVYGDEDRYPAAWGALAHEAGHAAHSKWFAPDHLRGTAADSAAEILEESRIEAAHLARRPTDLPYIRACVTTLVMDDMSGAGIDDKWSAAHVAALILARSDAGILEPDEVEPIRDKCEQILGAELLGKLAEIWNAAHRVGDDDATTMLDLGAAWCDLLGTDPRQPEPRPQHRQPGIGAGQSGGGIAEAVAKVGENIAATEAAKAREQAQIDAAAAARAAKQKAQTSRARTAADTANKVFKRGNRPFTPGLGGGRAANPVTGARDATPAEKAAAGRLARDLRAAAYRERIETVTASAAPPGRLNMRGALARDAQIASGATPTALPFRHTTRRQTPTPPLRVGIAVDVSGSMDAATGPVASAAWILARAAALTDPDSRTATVSFNRSLTAITRPGRAPAQVTQFAAAGGGHALGHAIDALDAALELSRPGAGRLLVIASDGVYGDAEKAFAAGRIATLTASGCAVIHLHFGDGHHELIPGAALVRLADPAQAVATIAKAATAAIAATR